jgi:preprotein translocase subunit SecD
VTLTFGLLANLFTAVFVSRAIFDWVLSRKRVGEALSI